MLKIKGAKTKREVLEGDIHVTRVKIVSDKGTVRLHKPKGNYITIDPSLNSEHKYISRAIADELGRLLPVNDKDLVLVVGIGNRDSIADSLGVRVAERIFVTNHLKELTDRGYRPVCSIVPNVMGMTGIESCNIVRGIVKEINPKAVIVIDALCSRKLERINSTIQMCDTGIHPGTGIGNSRMGLTEETLGVPVIAIGVPTAVDIDAIAFEIIDKITDTLKVDINDHKIVKQVCNVLESDGLSSIIAKKISPNTDDPVMMYKDIEITIDDLTKIIADGVNLCLHKGMTLERMEELRR